MPHLCRGLAKVLGEIRHIPHIRFDGAGTEIPQPHLHQHLILQLSHDTLLWLVNNCDLDPKVTLIAKSNN